MTMTITKEVKDNFLITSEQILKLIRNKDGYIYLKNKYGCYEEYKVVIDDEVEE